MSPYMDWCWFCWLCWLFWSKDCTRFRGNPSRAWHPFQMFAARQSAGVGIPVWFSCEFFFILVSLVAIAIPQECKANNQPKKMLGMNHDASWCLAETPETALDIIICSRPPPRLGRFGAARARRASKCSSWNWYLQFGWFKLLIGMYIYKSQDESQNVYVWKIFHPFWSCPQIEKSSIHLYKVPSWQIQNVVQQPLSSSGLLHFAQPRGTYGRWRRMHDLWSTDLSSICISDDISYDIS